MCPDRQIISLYHDEELPSPWREKMASHLESCAECRTVLAEYGRLGACLKAALEEAVMTARIHVARERVWKKMTAPTLVIPGNPAAGSHAAARGTGAEKTGWRRSVSIPLPAAAAAVLLVIASLAFVGIRAAARPPVQDAMAAANIELDEQEVLPAQNMAEVLQYLSSQDSGEVMVIRLPESRTFSRMGEPALINAADYSRRDILP